MHKQKPGSTLGLRHIALYVTELEACVHFYTKLLDMAIEWQPDADNYYLTSGHDNLALHRAPEGQPPQKPQRLDHIGFILPTETAVDEWHAFFEANAVNVLCPAKKHRDGAKSFYCKDPDGNVVQMIYHPPLVSKN